MNQQRYKLKNIATINSGYSFRTKILNNPAGNTYAIQMRDISDDKSRIFNEPQKIDGEKINKKHLLRKDDILFMAKGSNNFAVCYDELFKPAVAASAFFVIRVSSDKVVPGFICRYINSSLGQNYLQANMAGTYIPNINKSILDEMEIILPSLEEQKKIVAFIESYQREKDLMHKCLEKKDILMTELMKKLITGKIHFINGKQ
ncbi:MAG: restriction endonuclease subunit S [Bacteroidales bacterium]|nr:restriction endonuclease subunit S [Bacteroidales bacterium]